MLVFIPLNGPMGPKKKSIVRRFFSQEPSAKRRKSEGTMGMAWGAMISDWGCTLWWCQQFAIENDHIL